MLTGCQALENNGGARPMAPMTRRTLTCRVQCENVHQVPRRMCIEQTNSYTNKGLTLVYARTFFYAQISRRLFKKIRRYRSKVSRETIFFCVVFLFCFFRHSNHWGSTTLGLSPSRPMTPCANTLSLGASPPGTPSAFAATPSSQVCLSGIRAAIPPYIEWGGQTRRNAR